MRRGGGRESCTLLEECTYFKVNLPKAHKPYATLNNFNTIGKQEQNVPETLYLKILIIIKINDKIFYEFYFLRSKI